LAVTLRAGKGQLLCLHAFGWQQRQQKQDTNQPKTKMDCAVGSNGIHADILPRQMASVTPASPHQA
jgi:hypothetical protein